MKHSDVEELALKARILEPVELLDSNQWRRDTLRELSTFAALVLEKAAENMSEWPAAQELRAMSSAMQCGDRG